jgi:Ca2+-binding RTX toxin-like protein
MRFLSARTLVWAAALAIGFGVTAGPAQAFVTSASVDGSTATLDLAGAFNTMTVSVAGGLVVHDQTMPTGGLASGADWDSARAGDQTVPADGSFTIVVDGGPGPDAITALAKRTELAGVRLDGEADDDVLVGADSNDTLHGGDGNDRLVGAAGDDALGGGAGNDTVMWSSPDGSDTVDGDAGDDRLEVNGSPILGDAFLLQPAAGRVEVSRLNLRTSHLDTSMERLQINGLGGPDFLGEEGDVSGLTTLSADGGSGADRLWGTDGPDEIRGGEGDDELHGGGGADRLIGDGGEDSIAGDAGDDTIVWNDGDQSDTFDGGDGRDDVEVNGSATERDVFNVQQAGARIRLDRLNLAPFSLDIGSGETLHVNGLGGDDELATGDLGAASLVAAGGAGDDALRGGGSSDTLLGGSGSDLLIGDGGLDIVSGDEGDDEVNVRDGFADLARGGDGWDAVSADSGLDLLDGFETVQAVAVAPPDPTPPPGTPAPPQGMPPGGPAAPARGITTRPVTIRGGTVRVRGRQPSAPVRMSCPASSGAHCTGILTLRAARATRRRRVFALGHARYDLRPGASATITVPLARVATRLADRNGHISALAVAGQQSVRRLTLALPRAAA